MTESAYQEAVSKISTFNNAELDQELEEAAILSEQSEMLVCCYLTAMRDRRAFEEFGYDSIYDYAKARFSYGKRKTRYLVSLGRKIEHLPKIREALASGKIGWCKASRLAPVASADNEAMWLESALSLTVEQLEKRIKDGTDTLASVLHLPLTEDRRILWENVLEIYRRRAGAEISPVQAFEYMLAENIAEWGHHLQDAETPEDDAKPTPEEPETPDAPEAETESPDEGDDSPDEDPPRDKETAKETGPVFPWAEPIDTASIGQGNLWESEIAAEKEFATNSDYNDVRQLVLERDGWKCTYPGCSARANLHVHHIKYRSHGGCHSRWNLTVLCHFHHSLLHAKHIDLKGRAPHALEWTPPKLMQAVLNRRRNNPSIWVDELDVREWSLERRAAPEPAVT